MRRATCRAEWETHNQELRMALETQLSTGQSSQYGRRLTYFHLRKQGIVSARDRMFKILRELDPVGIQQRPFGLQRTAHGTYRVPGVNFVWSVDGHHKLSDYGIEIYAGIDAYSRYSIGTTWIY